MGETLTSVSPSEGMLTEEIPDPAATDPAALRRQYESDLAAVVDRVGTDAAADETGIPAERLESLEEGADLTVEEAAAVVALAEDTPDAETVRLEVQDHLMLAMSSAVMDVDAVAASVDGDLDPRDVQQKVEGRQPMTLAEYTQIRHAIAAEGQW